MSVALEDQLAAAIAAADRARWSLLTCPLVAPLPAQSSMLRAAIAGAIAGGLRIPARLPVEWRAGGRAGGEVLHHGVTVRRADAQDRTVELYLVMNADLFPGDLLVTAFHELQHCADVLDPNTRALDRLERERRAVLYAAAAMGWR